MLCTQTQKKAHYVPISCFNSIQQVMTISFVPHKIMLSVQHLPQGQHSKQCINKQITLIRIC